MKILAPRRDVLNGILPDESMPHPSLPAPCLISLLSLTKARTKSRTSSRLTHLHLQVLGPNRPGGFRDRNGKIIGAGS